MTDKEIIEHLQHNRYSKAIKGLYTIQPAVKKYIVANSGTGEDAKDIFQDALVILYKNIHTGQFVLTVPLKTYLQSVVRNRWLQELRQRKKLPVATTEADISEEVTDEEPDFRFAEAAFNLLGDKCRQLLILFYYKQKSFREIAAELAFSDEKVAKNQKYRCIQKAKENYLTISRSGNHE